MEGHILELNTKCEVINATGGKHQVGKEEIRVKLKLYETYLMTALLYGLETWGKIDKDWMNGIEKIQVRALKRIFNLLISASYFGLIMETGT